MQRTFSSLRQLSSGKRAGLLLAALGCQLAGYMLWPAAGFEWFFSVPNVILCSLLFPRRYSFIIAGLVGIGATWLHMHHDVIMGGMPPRAGVLFSNLAGGLISSLTLAWLTLSTNDEAAFFEVVARYTQEFVFLLDSTGHVAYINEAGAAILGYTPTEIIGKNVSCLWPVRYAPAAGQMIDSWFRNRGTSLERIHVVNRGGLELILAAKLQLLNWKGETYVLGVAQDITGVELSEQLYSAAFDAINTPMAIRKPDGEIICCNEAFAASVGKNKRELSGSRALAYGIDSSYLDILDTSVATGSPQHVEVTTPDGRILSGSTFPIAISQGSLSAVITLTRDITAAKQTEANMVQTARLAAVGQLAAGVAHNINNVLAAICVSAELLQLQPLEVGPRVSRDILSAVERGSTMVQKLYRLSGGSEPPKPESLRVAEVFLGVMQLMQTRLCKEGIDVVQDVPDGATVYADANLLHQILMNLVINAIQAVSEGDGRLVLAARSEGDQWVVLTVADNGCGIPPEQLEHIFTPFFTTKATVNGTGLGLSTSLQMVRAMGGDLRVESRPGEGASFTIMLPAQGELSPATGRD